MILFPRIDAADATRVIVDGWIGTDGIEAFLPANGGRQLQQSQYHLKMPKMATLQVALLASPLDN